MAEHGEAPNDDDGQSKPQNTERMTQRRELGMDLDYLERRRGIRSELQSVTEAETSPDSISLVKVILLGANGVGKTSIVQQFVWNNFSDDYVATDRKHTYYPSVIINDHLYELKIVDLPMIPYFPVNSYYEWTDYRFFGLRSANAYVLVFDLSNLDTFEYTKTIHEQIAESRDTRKVPILVVGNKQDLLPAPSGNSSRMKIETMAGSSDDGSDERRRRNIKTLVKKQWKCRYIQCSARLNWNVIAVFKEVMTALDAIEHTHSTGRAVYKEVCSPVIDNIHKIVYRNKCVIF